MSATARRPPHVEKQTHVEKQIARDVAQAMAVSHEGGQSSRKQCTLDVRLGRDLDRVELPLDNADQLRRVVIACREGERAVAELAALRAERHAAADGQPADAKDTVARRPPGHGQSLRTHPLIRGALFPN